MLANVVFCHIFVLVLRELFDKAEKLYKIDYCLTSYYIIVLFFKFCVLIDKADNVLGRIYLKECYLKKSPHYYSKFLL